MNERLRSTLFSWQARVLVVGLAGAGALVAVFRATQPRTEALRIQPDIAAVEASAPTFARMLELYAGTHIDSSNRVEVLLNGDGTYPRLWEDLRTARKSITVQSYYSLPGAMADTLSQILRDRARAGVRVLLLLDAFGSEAMPDAWTAELRSGGVHVALLRPLRWHSLHGAADRSHVRAVVVDGRVGYTGGFGFADYWSGDGRHAAQWRETNVRVEGPAALQLQAAFAANVVTVWRKPGRAPLRSGRPDVFILALPRGGVPVAFEIAIIQRRQHEGALMPLTHSLLCPD